MTRILTTFALALLVCLLLATGPAIANTSQKTTTISVTMPVPSISDGALVVADGVILSDLPAAPALPVYRELVPLPDVGRWSVSYEVSGAYTMHTDIPLDPAPSLNAKGREVSRPDPSIYERPQFYPAKLVTATEVWERGSRYVQIEIYPLQYHPVSGDLRGFVDVTATLTVQPERGDRRGPAAPDIMTGLQAGLRIYTADRGIYVLTHDDLVGEGWDVGSDPRNWQLTLDGEPVAIQIEGEADGIFDLEDRVLFYAAPYEGRYMQENVYWLRQGGQLGDRIAQRHVPPDASPATEQHRATFLIDEHTVYEPDMERPQDGDFWFSQALRLSYYGTQERVHHIDFTLDDPILDSSTPVQIESRIVGHDAPTVTALDNHAVRLSLNDDEFAYYTWHGHRVDHVGNEALTADQLTAGTNRLTLFASLFDVPNYVPLTMTLYPDTFTVSYDAFNRVDEGTAEIHLPAFNEPPTHVRVDGFAPGSASEVTVWHVADAWEPAQVTSITGAGGTVDFWDEAQNDPAYYVVHPSSYRTPHLEASLASDLTNGTADYIAVVPEELWHAPAGKLGVDDLLTRRESEGLRTAKVRLQDIYDTWSFGKVDPEAIRAFLTYAYYHWNVGEDPPAYVLLVGDGSHDFKEYRENYELNLVPPYLENPLNYAYGEVPADGGYAAMEGREDGFLEMNIGRLPAQSKLLEDGTIVPPSYDLDVMLTKLFAYETAPMGAWQTTYLMVTGDPAGNASFAAIADDLLADVPPAYAPTKLYYLEDPALQTPTQMRSAIHTGFNSGALIAHWIGHGSPIQWDGSSFHNIFDIPELQPNTVWPLTLSAGCTTSYFTQDRSWSGQYNSLGEAAVRGEGRGSVADIGDTALTFSSGTALLHDALLEELLIQRAEHLGEALTAAKSYTAPLTAHGVAMAHSHMLMGDPAMHLNLPALPRLVASELTLDNPPAHYGGTGQYTAHLVNDGDAPAEDVSVEVTYDPSQVTVIEAGGGDHDPATSTITWDMDIVPIGAVERSFVVEFSSTAQGPIVLSGIITGDGLQPVALTHEAPLSVATATATATATPTATATASSTPSLPTASPTSTTPATATVTATPTVTATATASSTPVNRIFLPLIGRYAN